MKTVLAFIWIRWFWPRLAIQRTRRKPATKSSKPGTRPTTKTLVEVYKKKKGRRREGREPQGSELAGRRRKGSAAAKPKGNRNNPKPELRARAIAGLEFMNDFAYAGKNRWTDGKIYDPEVGKTYSCKMTLVSEKKLEVRGYPARDFAPGPDGGVDEVRL